MFVETDALDRLGEDESATDVESDAESETGMSELSLEELGAEEFDDGIKRYVLDTIKSLAEIISEKTKKIRVQVDIENNGLPFTLNTEFELKNLKDDFDRVNQKFRKVLKGYSGKDADVSNVQIILQEADEEEKNIVDSSTLSSMHPQNTGRRKKRSKPRRKVFKSHFQFRRTRKKAAIEPQRQYTVRKKKSTKTGKKTVPVRQTRKKLRRKDHSGLNMRTKSLVVFFLVPLALLCLDQFFRFLGALVMATQLQDLEYTLHHMSSGLPYRESFNLSPLLQLIVPNTHHDILNKRILLGTYFLRLGGLLVLLQSLYRGWQFFRIFRPKPELVLVPADADAELQLRFNGHTNVTHYVEEQRRVRDFDEVSL